MWMPTPTLIVNPIPINPTLLRKWLQVHLVVVPAIHHILMFAFLIHPLI
jgi:hypothetical protein